MGALASAPTIAHRPNLIDKYLDSQAY
jgi:hypothetical protein